MSYSEIIKNELNKFSENEVIFASKLYKEKLIDNVSETSFYKYLERMVKDCKISKISKGIYYFSKRTNFGTVPIAEKDILKVLISNEAGMVIGYHLYNKLKLTTQISKKILVYSSSIENITKNIGNIEVKNIELKYTKININAIEMLEVIQNLNKIQDLNYRSLYVYFEKCSKNYDELVYDGILRKIKYKKSTIAFLKEILDYFNVKNNLSKYLSSLSKYNYKNMEDIYELAFTKRRI